LPVVSMVPREELPPEVELTDQVTEVLEEPVTVAEKGRVEPARTLAVVGEMEMVGAGVGPGVGVGWGELEEPQEIRTRARRDTSAKRKSLRSIEDIVGIVSKGRRWGTTGRRDRKRAVAREDWPPIGEIVNSKMENRKSKFGGGRARAN
jgi:hypothetical protein